MSTQIGTGQSKKRQPKQSSEFEKVGITMPRNVVSIAREKVRSGKARSFSALVSEAVAEKLERDQLQEVLDQMDAEYGPVSPERLEWADEVIDRLQKD